MIESAVSMLTSLIEKSDERSESIASALNNLADAINRKEAQAPDMRPSEILEKFMQQQANLGVSQVSQVMGHGTKQGHDSPRPKTAAEKVREYLDENPSARHEAVRDLADKIGVGKSTVSRVLNEE